ncbi:hypothetical protein AZ54_09935 [Xanthomonas oryzae pv. oryzae PXO86]|nr:hypothetical protein AZ54_09935 [Xanthomonas oryzae pv. oryzae PXO86]
MLEIRHKQIDSLKTFRHSIGIYLDPITMNVMITSIQLC